MIELRDYITNEKNLASEFVRKHKENKRKIYLYGNGVAAYWYIKFLILNGLKIEAVIDSDSKKWGVLHTKI